MMPTTVEELNRSPGNIYIDLGAGGKSPRPGHTSFDILPADGVDICGDLSEVLPTVNSSIVDGVYTRHFLEHADDPTMVLREITRICREGATVDVIVPHFSNPFFYSDVTHQRYFGLYSFCYLATSRVPFRRGVPSYARIPGLELDAVRMNFFSYRPRSLRHLFKRVLGKLVNANTWMQEFYEENLCWLFPCYELHYRLTVRKASAGVIS